ncbi:hypothetical protein C8R44DRAFT_748437 [Mycena epipterygia]|nr:hypothetical protein C8R44DRAFT_748437 [Mycena epipterygia]
MRSMGWNVSHKFRNTAVDRAKEEDQGKSQYMPHQWCAENLKVGTARAGARGAGFASSGRMGDEHEQASRRDEGERKQVACDSKGELQKAVLASSNRLNKLAQRIAALQSSLPCSRRRASTPHATTPATMVTAPRRLRMYSNGRLERVDWWRGVRPETGIARRRLMGEFEVLYSSGYEMKRSAAGGKERSMQAQSEALTPHIHEGREDSARDYMSPTTSSQMMTRRWRRRYCSATTRERRRALVEAKSEERSGNSEGGDKSGGQGRSTGGAAALKEQSSLVHRVAVQPRRRRIRSVAD